MLCEAPVKTPNAARKKERTDEQEVQREGDRQRDRYVQGERHGHGGRDRQTDKRETDGYARKNSAFSTKRDERHLNA